MVASDVTVCTIFVAELMKLFARPSVATALKCDCYATLLKIISSFLLQFIAFVCIHYSVQ